MFYLKPDSIEFTHHQCIIIRCTTMFNKPVFVLITRYPTPYGPYIEMPQWVRFQKIYKSKQLGNMWIRVTPEDRENRYTLVTKKD